ncbi:MAG: tRNA lysidine(34) synthetase TilS [Cytophagales bacterium]|nr:tRNA lysidine(34) synthetase TilS [Bernardetiaceae bacterium]MDW8211747.1 tRNA lysidine(34) synthetase TilS [Cytophagales bacterium]
MADPAFWEGKLLAFISQNELFTTESRLLLAVSGGLDSMAMATMLHRLGYSIALAHVNYQLRGRESEADERFVRQWAEKHAVKCFVQRFETQPIAARWKKGIQETARKLRYQWFDEIVNQHQFSHLLTAHHLDDALETVLYRLAKGSSSLGLRGIAVKQGRVVRPMLAFTRKELLNYAQAIGLQWREDSSNASDKYARNFIRHRVIPALKRVNPSLVENFAYTYQRLHDAAAWLESSLKEAARRCVQPRNGLIYLPLAQLKSLPSARLFLDAYLKKFGFNYKTIVSIAAHISTPCSGKQFFSATHCLTFDRKALIISRLQEEPTTEVLLPDFGTHQIDKQQAIVVEKIDAGKGFGNESSFSVQVNLQALRFPLKVRPWQPGDRMQPLGMKGSKKISDLLIDLKVPVPVKKRVRLLCNAEGQVLWLIGYRLSELCRCHESDFPRARITLVQQQEAK